MGTRHKRAERCARCRLHQDQCLCRELPQLDLTTRLVLIMHHREMAKTTATGPWTLQALRHSELHIHGQLGRELDFRSLHSEGRRVLLLFPSEGARTLTRDLVLEDPRPITLVVPDGNWRQASRAERRIPGLAQAERVVLREGQKSRYFLRNEPKRGGLATFEAIARALGVLESPEVQQQLESAFNKLVEASLATSGTKPASRISSASPQHVTSPLEILYRDEHLVAVNKPAGISVHRGWAVDGVPLLQLVRDQIGAAVFPVHRLDRATSGVLLFALSGEVARDIQVAFNRHQIQKRYLVLCRGHEANLKRVDHPLAKEKGAVPRPAVTRFQLLGQFERYGLFAAWPETGRLHQIRRHLKHQSHPIIGDVRYGKGEHNRIFRERFGFHRLALHAAELTLQHPRTHQTLAILAPMSRDFADLLAELGLTEALLATNVDGREA